MLPIPNLISRDNMLLTTFLCYFFFFRGVTANIAFRNTRQSIIFSDAYSKLRGGEDVDVCIGKKLVANKKARVVHPWWGDGQSALSQFWVFFCRVLRWAFCDGTLVTLHREHTYLSAPNWVEMIPISFLICIMLGKSVWMPAFLVWLSDLCVGTLHMRFMSQRQASHNELPKSKPKMKLLASCIIGTLFTQASELGHFCGHMRALRIPWRFDWHLTTMPESVEREEKRRAKVNFMFYLAITAFVIWIQ